MTASQLNISKTVFFFICMNRLGSILITDQSRIPVISVLRGMDMEHIIRASYVYTHFKRMEFFILKQTVLMFYIIPQFIRQFQFFEKYSFY